MSDRLLSGRFCQKGARHGDSSAEAGDGSAVGRQDAGIAQFVTEVTQGLNCSPFEARAVLGVVQEVFAPLWREASSLPGRTILLAVDAEEPAGKPVRECRKQAVILHVHRGADDDRLLQRGGPRAFRRARLPDLCQVALSQGGLLTAEDLAYRVFFVTPRTISRDLAALRQAEPGRMIPMRSTVHDLGPVLTHRTQIVRLALEGKTTTEICRRLKHSPEAVANYLATFTRVAQLAERGSQAGAPRLPVAARTGPGAEVP